MQDNLQSSNDAKRMFFLARNTVARVMKSTMCSECGLIKALCRAEKQNSDQSSPNHEYL